MAILHLLKKQGLDCHSQTLGEAIGTG